MGAWIAQEQLHHRKTHPRLRDDLPKPHPWHCLHSLRVGFRQLVRMESHLSSSFLTVHINFGEGDPVNLVNFRNFLDLEVAYRLSYNKPPFIRWTVSISIKLLLNKWKHFSFYFDAKVTGKPLGSETVIFSESCVQCRNFSGEETDR